MKNSGNQFISLRHIIIQSQIGVFQSSLAG